MTCNLREFKEFIDNEMIVILGQMDSPTQIFEHVFLVAFALLSCGAAVSPAKSDGELCYASVAFGSGWFWRLWRLFAVSDYEQAQPNASDD